MRKTRGLSMAVTAALLILVSIALVASLWLYSNKFTSGGSVVQASANLISKRWVNNKPVYVVDIAIQSKADSRLTLSSLTVIYTLKDGTTHSQTVNVGGGSGGGGGGSGIGITVTPSNNVAVDPNSANHVTVTITGQGNNPVVEMSFQLVFQDEAGNTYTVQTNSVQTG